MERAGHTVVCTYDGQAAIDEMQKRIETGEKMFDKVVLGLMLPKKDGLEVVGWIRTHPQTEKVWVALKIAKSQDYEVFQDMYTADMYFTAPVIPGDLIR
jgi:DNA-binding response OmpR family regulator